MALKSRKPNSLALTEEEKRTLALALSEMKARGITLPDPKTKKEKPVRWSVDHAGYFIKVDGKHFEANDHQERFIHSKARFLLPF